MAIEKFPLPPSAGFHGDAPTGFGVDYILELCHNSAKERPRDFQEGVERLFGGNLESCLMKCAWKLWSIN